MPVFVEDPAQFSKERLKSELIAHNVALPPPESKKHAYVELYLKHVKTNSTDFSSDEEEDHLNGSAEKEEAAEMVDLGLLTDDQLKAKLLQYGVKAGPILASTRFLYEKKLKRLLDSSAQHKINGTADAGLYSDSEEEDDEEQDSESEQLLSETKPRTETSKTASRIENRFSPQFKQTESERWTGLRAAQTVGSRALRDLTRLDKDTMTSKSLCLTSPSSRQKQTIREPASDVLSEMFPDAERTPTGIFATKRRSIKGAAGRPVQFKYPELPLLSPTILERQEIQQRLVPLWVQVIVFLMVVCLLYIIYSCMDEQLSSPFTALLDGLHESALTCISSFTGA
nr:uncharacterized protein LOC436879 isoform X7 [Danio rerio]|eukprot:XP_021325455.1 uncharacterized protein LOC436879 isoform X7 [Danio rerio]